MTQTEDGWTLGDVIVGIDSETIASYDDLYNALDGKKPGERVKLQIVRAGKQRTLDIELVVVQ